MTQPGTVNKRGLYARYGAPVRMSVWRSYVDVALSKQSVSVQVYGTIDVDWFVNEPLSGMSIVIQLPISYGVQLALIQVTVSCYLLTPER